MLTEAVRSSFRQSVADSHPDYAGGHRAWENCCLYEGNVDEALVRICVRLSRLEPARSRPITSLWRKRFLPKGSDQPKPPQKCARRSGERDGNTIG